MSVSLKYSRFSAMALLLGVSFLSDVQAKEPAFSYPVIKSTAPNAAGFVPAGWKIEEQKTGDLNADGMSDLVLVIKRSGEKEEAKDVSQPTFEPRILVIAFKEKSANGYKLIVQDHALITQTFASNMADPFEGGMTVKNGSFRLGLTSLMTMGSWMMENATFTFKYNGACMKLIGYDATSTHRASQDFESTSINYLTKKIKLSKGNNASKAEKITWKKLNSNANYCLSDVGDGLGFSAGK